MDGVNTMDKLCEEQESNKNKNRNYKEILANNLKEN